MTIRSLAFEDTRNSWELEEFQSDELNLLVGLSGAGKTHARQPLRCLRRGGRTMDTSSWVPMESHGSDRRRRVHVVCRNRF
jgi:hypothetical protein